MPVKKSQQINVNTIVINSYLELQITINSVNNEYSCLGSSSILYVCNFNKMIATNFGRTQYMFLLLQLTISSYYLGNGFHQ